MKKYNNKMAKKGCVYLMIWSSSWQKTDVSDDLMIQVRNEGERVVIGRVVKGGAAERSGNLHPGGRDHDYDDYDDDYYYEEVEIRVKAAHSSTIAL